MNVTTFYPDGTTETRPLTEAELAQIEADKANEINIAWDKLRTERNSLLAQCDWTVLADTPTPTATWKAYRQQLRDLPANTTDPFNPVWPTPPA